MRDTTFWEDMDNDSEEYRLAYELIRHAMFLVWESEGQSHLLRLKNVLEKAAFFVNVELDDLPEKTEKLGLHKWQREEREREEEERLEQEEEEEEERLEQEEEERRIEEEWQQAEYAQLEATNQ